MFRNADCGVAYAERKNKIFQGQFNTYAPESDTVKMYGEFFKRKKKNQTTIFGDGASLCHAGQALRYMVREILRKLHLYRQDMHYKKPCKKVMEFIIN